MLNYFLFCLCLLFACVPSDMGGEAYRKVDLGTEENNSKNNTAALRLFRGPTEYRNALALMGSFDRIGDFKTFKKWFLSNVCTFTFRAIEGGQDYMKILNDIRIQCGVQHSTNYDTARAPIIDVIFLMYACFS